MYGGNCFMLTIDCVLQPVALLSPEPFRVTRPIRHHCQEHETKEDRRHPLDDEKPLPALQATKSIHLEDRRREWCADRQRNRNSNHEGSDDPSPVLQRKPIRQVEDHARKEPRLRNPQQKANYDKARGTLHEHHTGRDCSPRDHNTRDPPPSPRLLQHEVARDLEDEIAEEEDAGSKSINIRRNAEINIHLDCSKANIDPIDVRQDVGDEQDRHQAQKNLLDCCTMSTFWHFSHPCSASFPCHSAPEIKLSLDERLGL